MISIVVIDDQPLVREAFSTILESEADLHVVGQASNGEEGIAVARRERPDIALVDVQMPVLDGIDTTRGLLDLRSPPRVIILTTFDIDEYVFRALQAGASGFLLKDATREELFAAVRTVALGESLLAPAVTRRVIEGYVAHGSSSEEQSSAIRALTAREKDVLRLLAQGQSNREIAASIHVSTTTVKSHVGALLMKLGLRDRVQLVVFAYESGFVRSLE